MKKQRSLKNEKRRKRYKEKAYVNSGNANEKRRELRMTNAQSPQMKKQRSLENEKRRKKRKDQVKINDCDRYSREYDEKSRFIVCAMCGIEDSQTGSTLVADNADLIDKCGIRKEYEEYVKVTDESTMYDKIFIDEVKKHFDCGLIKGLKSICASCISEIKKIVK